MLPPCLTRYFTATRGGKASATSFSGLQPPGTRTTHCDVSETSAAHGLASPSIFAVAIRRPQACEWNSIEGHRAGIHSKSCVDAGPSISARQGGAEPGPDRRFEILSRAREPQPDVRTRCNYAARDLLEILEDRYGDRSTIITSQLPPAQWHDYLADATLADAICDRVLHNAHRMVLKGPSRRKETKLEQLTDGQRRFAPITILPILLITIARSERSR